jgi:HK97 family phage portal protein
MGLRTFYKNFRALSRNDSEIEERSRVFSLLDSALSKFLGIPVGSDSDFPVSAATAMRISTVYTCVLVRAESLSTLPISVLQSTKKGTRKAYEHPAYRLIHNKPNPFQTASSFWKSVSAHIDLYGNCFAIIKYSGRWQPSRIDLVPDPGAVEILETPSGNARYRYDGQEYADYEILHFKDLSLDGYYGCSRISYNADTIGYASKLRKFGKNSIGKRAEGFFTTNNTFDVIKKQQEALQDGWTKAISEGKVPFLPLGLDYKKLQITPAEALYLDAINATKEDIYGIFRIPPTLAQNYDRATFANAEQQDLVFVKHTMLPLITNIEQECNAKLFSEANATSEFPYYVKANVNAFLRGDFQTRTMGYRTLWERGLITGNMVAELEDWDTFEGGDERFIPMNMIPLSRIDDFLDKLTKPVQTNVGNEGGGDNQERSAMTIQDLISMNGYNHTEPVQERQGIIYKKP